MPVGQQPTPPEETAVQVHNTERLKIYYKLKPLDSWIEERSLVCVGHGKTKGSKIGSAQFVVLNDSNDTIDTQWSNTELAMRFNAAVRYNIDMSTGYKTPYIVKVTDVFNGIECAVWQGYLSTASQDFVTERATVTGLSFAGLLDQQQILGGWYLTNKVTTPTPFVNVDYYYDHIPVYNPRGIGNKSQYFRLPEGAYKANGVDKTKLKSTVAGGNLWTIKDLLNQIFARCTADLFDPATEANSDVFTPNYWIWAKDIYRKILPFDMSEATGEGGPLENSSTLNDYSLQGKTIWEAIVELVESVDGLTVSEEMEAVSLPPEDGGEPLITAGNQRPYIKIVNLRGNGQ